MPSNWYTLPHLFNFSWRASRTEFFLLHLFLLGVIYAPIILLVLMFDFKGEMDDAGSALMAVFGTIWTFVMFGGLVAMLAVNVRRLHDQEKSGWWWLATWLPLIGWLVWLVFVFTRGDEQDNLYGPNPRTHSRPGQPDELRRVFD